MTFNAICVHAHFYQPPRQDPLTGIIPIEPGASPFPNWNERIHAECYRPNAQHGNFERISFNIGPTLHEWIDNYDRSTGELIVAQDQRNVQQHGVGNAIAQAYNHTILPLANYQDKVTQVTWGIADFEHRFGRKPQGMWLPEAAVDLETMNVLVNQGIEFTILAPWQVSDPTVDVTKPYRLALPGGKSITVFLYHHGLSGGISFNPSLTINADYFAAVNLAQHYNPNKAARGEPQIILLATDGELYGHHQPFRDRFLARLVDGASSMMGISPIYPALWLQRYPVYDEIHILENTSWSCHHGVERWKGLCDCTPRDIDWKQAFRKSLDRLADALDEIFEATLSEYISDPWELRNQYIRVILGKETAESLIKRSAGGVLPQDIFIRIHLLLEAQRERQRMYTSCGFFFEDFDRIEPKNNLAYAAQLIRLVRIAIGIDLEPSFLSDLKPVYSWKTGLRAEHVYTYFARRSIWESRVY